MVDVTNELIYEVLRKVQEQVARTQDDVRGIRDELTAMRGYMLAMQKDIHNLDEMGHDHSRRLERIERRLELKDEKV
jgi:hypothetical protein